MPKSLTITPSFPQRLHLIRPVLPLKNASSTTWFAGDLLSAWQEDHIWSVTKVITAIRNGDVVDRYHTSGTAVQQVGWKVLDIATARKPGRVLEESEERKTEQVLPSSLTKGDPQEVVKVEATRKHVELFPYLCISGIGPNPLAQTARSAFCSAASSAPSPGRRESSSRRLFRRCGCLSR